MRPALHILAARYCGSKGDAPVRVAAVLELVHNATLMHDDVIDSAESRRGRVSSNKGWGNSMTVLAGDWLYMQAFHLALTERNFRLLDILIGLTQTMVEGELIQLTWLGRADINEATVLDIARRKTARLFEAATRLGAVLAAWDAGAEERLAQYGFQLGLAFQVIDDLLDFTADEARLGKPVMSDLREGKVTLPLVYALETGGPAAREKVETVLREKGFDTVQPGDIFALVTETGSLERARETAVRLAREGTDALAGLPHNSYRPALEAIPQFVLTRDH